MSARLALGDIGSCGQQKRSAIAASVKHERIRLALNEAGDDRKPCR